jgi:hypothetical protein
VSLSLPFPLPPRHIAVEATGWDAAGVSDGRLPSGALEFVRQREAQGDGDGDGDGEIRATAFPPFVQVMRTLSFGVDWTVATSVQRIAPREGAFTVAVGLLPDEVVVTQDIEVENGVATVAFVAGQNTVTWQSRLPTASGLTLTAGDGTSSAETWRFAAGYDWHVVYEGLPAARAIESGSALLTEFLPRPGEMLSLELSRPEAVSGDTIAIDSVEYTRSVGGRASDATLALVYRSTRAAEHPVVLPDGSELESVAIDGAVVPLRLDGSTLTLPVTPGTHHVAIEWRESEGIGLHATFPTVDFGTGATNVTIALAIPEDRWTLLTHGPTLGPAVIYWAELAVFVLAALILGRIPLSPLRTHEWLLLGLGLSTFSWPVLVLFAAWAFAMSARRRMPAGGPDRRFNAVQVALALLTLVTLIALIGSVANGLLGTPNMHIVSPVQGRPLSWFTDRIDGATPSAGAISVSLWFYKAAMLAWALWLSFAALRWLRFAWTAFSENGIWRSGTPRAAHA